MNILPKMKISHVIFCFPYLFISCAYWNTSFAFPHSPRSTGQQRTEEFENILLRLTFPSFYNGYSKACCKLYPGRCYRLLDSAGYTCDSLKGRVTTTKRDGLIEFRISKVGLEDGGYYRCIVLGTQPHIYKDYYVEVSVISNHSGKSDAAPTTVTAPGGPGSTPDPTGPAVAPDTGHNSKAPWSVGLRLAAIVSIAVAISVTLAIWIVCFTIKTKLNKKLDKNEGTGSESLRQEAPETAGIVYTTVAFGAQREPSELYASNNNIRKTRTLAPVWRTDRDGMVEYSTLAIHK